MLAESERGNVSYISGTREVGGSLFCANFSPRLVHEVANVAVPKNISSSSVLQFFHERFGHQDRAHVKKIVAERFGLSVKTDNSVCEPCVLGKACYRMYPTFKIKTYSENISTVVE
jgi:hypothetical protein